MIHFPFFSDRLQNIRRIALCPKLTELNEDHEEPVSAEYSDVLRLGKVSYQQIRKSDSPMF